MYICTHTSIYIYIYRLKLQHGCNHAGTSTCRQFSVYADILYIHIYTCIYVIYLHRTSTLLDTATCCNGNTLQHTETYCNTLQHTATCCNMLQHAATIMLRFEAVSNFEFVLFKVVLVHVIHLYICIYICISKTKCIYMHMHIYSYINANTRTQSLFSPSSCLCP